MTTETPAAPATALRIGLVVLAAIVLMGALLSLPAAFYDYNPTTSLGAFAQHLTSAKLLIAPLIAGAALLFALMCRLPRAIIALAALMLAEWISDLPSFAIHGFEFSAARFTNVVGLTVFAQSFIYPLLAVAAIVLARRNRRLVLAAVLVALPTVVHWGGVLAFAIAVAIYGF